MLKVCTATAQRATRDRRAPALLTAGLLGLVFGGAPAQAQVQGPPITLRCSSNGLQLNRCPVGTDNGVELVKRRSLLACKPGETWGYDGQGIWVTRGCSADFRIGVAHTPSAAVASPQNSANPMTPQGRLALGSRPPQWAVGTFVARDEYERLDIQLTVAADGRVQGKIGDQAFTGVMTSNRLDTGRHVFSFVHSGTGFYATNERNGQHHIQFNGEMGTN